MKTFTISASLMFCAVFTPAQFSIGFKAGASPTTQPGTHFIIVNRQDPLTEFTFNVERIRHDGQFGFITRFDIKPWWVALELLAARSQFEYSVFYGQDRRTAGAPMRLYEEQTYIDVPVSAGVDLKTVEIFSGFTATHNITTHTELDQIAGYSASLHQWQIGWHSGVSKTFGPATIDLRYQQTFSNYGSNRFVNGQELLLRNAPGRLIVMVGVRFN